MSNLEISAADAPVAPVLVKIKQVGVEVVFDGPVLEVVEALAEAALEQARANKANSEALREFASILSGKKHIGVVNSPAISVTNGSSLGIGLKPIDPLGAQAGVPASESVAETPPDPVD